jgi:hypothetical protein
VGDQPSAEHPRDANALIFRRFVWDPASIHHQPPNGGAHAGWWLFGSRTAYWEYDPDNDREITLQ